MHFSELANACVECLERCCTIPTPGMISARTRRITPAKLREGTRSPTPRPKLNHSVIDAGRERPGYDPNVDRHHREFKRTVARR